MAESSDEVNGEPSQSKSPYASMKARSRLPIMVPPWHRCVRLLLGSFAFFLVSLAFGAAQENEGVAIWANSGSTPGYAFWDGTSFSGSKSMRSTGKRWRIIQGAYSATRDEAIVVGVTDDERVTAQMYRSGSWNDLPFSPLDDRASNSYWWGFDVRYESQSGNAVLVWHEGSRDTIMYRTWNGSSWSAESRINTPVRGGEHDELNLEASPITDEMVLIVGVRSGSDYCMVWDGRSWGNGLSLRNSDNGDLTNVNVAYEQNSGRAMAVYADDSSSLRYRIWDGSRWSGEGSVSAPSGIRNTIRRLAIGADPSSNRIAVGVTSYSDNAFWLGIWDGRDEWGSVIRASSASSANIFHGVAVAFEGHTGKALATYTQSGDEVRYRTWATTWSGEYRGPDLGNRPNSMMLSASPGTNEIMLSVQDNGQDANFCVWDGDSWGTVNRMTSNTGEDLNKNQPYLFLWKPALPTMSPTPVPTRPPSRNPTKWPTRSPTRQPTGTPTPRPTTSQPTPFPTPIATPVPTPYPTKVPSREPTRRPTDHPTMTPTSAPTPLPTRVPTTSPTRNPTMDPTRAPTRKPTNQPTMTPTSAPTPLPTPGPSESPTRNPTVEPTMKPTNPPPTPAPTPFPTPAPTSSPTSKPTRRPTMEPTTRIPTSGPSLFPTPDSSLPPSLSPTPSPPTQGPTELPTMTPTTQTPITPQPNTYSASTVNQTMDSALLKGTRVTGKVCSGNVDCQSNTCRNGACMGSPSCYPIKHKYGTPFDENKVNVVFVASAFDAATHEEWWARVNSTFGMFQNYNMFSNDVEQLNVFLVDPVKLDSSFCVHGCGAIDRLLCCDMNKAHTLTGECLPVGANTQTVVIHNSEKYGGAGYTYQNIATVSVHPKAPLVAVHELGHSLFQLTDEYSYGPGTGLNPNCDSSRKCKKWSDLVGEENTPDGYEPVQCLPGCRNGNFFIGSKSFMDNLDLPVGAVNERFTCCTYQVLTKSMPSYCDAFKPSPDYLFNYCKNNDYQNYGFANYEVEPLLAIPGEAAEQNAKANYVYVTDPVLVTITSWTRRNGNVAFKSRQIPLPPGLFHRSQVNGDFKNAKAAKRKGIDSLMKVVVVYRTGKEVLLFSRNTTIEVPLPEDLQQRPEEPRVVSERSNVVEVVLDTKGQRIKKVRSKAMAV